MKFRFNQKKGIKERIRVMETESKEKSMRLLYDGETKAAIMPEAVGILSRKTNGVEREGT